MGVWAAERAALGAAMGVKVTWALRSQVCSGEFFSFLRLEPVSSLSVLSLCPRVARGAGGALHVSLMIGCDFISNLVGPYCSYSYSCPPGWKPTPRTAATHDTVTVISEPLERDYAPAESSVKSLRSHPHLFCPPPSVRVGLHSRYGMMSHSPNCVCQPPWHESDGIGFSRCPDHHARWSIP